MQSGNKVDVTDVEPQEHWKKCAGDITDAGLVTLKTDTGKIFD